jgi:Rod binding domain-containing protein
MFVGSIAASGAAGDAQGAPSPKLVQAAHEFEGQMMKGLLGPMTNGDALTGSEDCDTGLDSGSALGSTGALGDFASEALGKALSERGGFGIADRIVKELSRSGNGDGNQHRSGKVIKNSHGNTVMRASE